MFLGKLDAAAGGSDEYNLHREGKGILYLHTEMAAVHCLTCSRKQAGCPAGCLPLK